MTETQSLGRHPEITPPRYVQKDAGPTTNISKLVDFILRKKKEETKPPSNNIEEVIAELTPLVQQGEYCQLVGGHPDEQRYILENLLADLTIRSDEDSPDNTPVILRITPPHDEPITFDGVLEDVIDQWNKNQKDNPFQEEEGSENIQVGQRFTNTLKTFADRATENSKRIVLIIDNAHNIPPKWRGDLFTSCRGLYNGRPLQQSLKALNIVAATTEDSGSFIPNRDITPYNIGKKLTLE